MVFEIILAGKPHSHVPPRASRALRLDFLLRALCSYFLSRALIRRGCEQSHLNADACQICLFDLVTAILREIDVRVPASVKVETFVNMNHHFSVI